MPSVMVGGHKTEITWVEYFAAILPKGTPIEWECKDTRLSSFMSKHDIKGVGIVLYTWFYDGVCLVVDIAGEQHSLMLGCSRKMKIRRLKDMTRLAGQGMHGDGI